MAYSKQVMEHFENPRNVGKMENADGVGEVGNAKCGDIMKMYLKIDNDIITDVKFNTFGCGAAIATSSIATEMIKGKKHGDAQYAEGTTPRQFSDLLGSLCDLISGSGDKGTPVVYIQGYFDDYSDS